MRKNIFIIIIFSLTFFIGCELSQTNYQYEINLITIALDYNNTDVSNLHGTLNDAKEVEKAIRKICLRKEINYKSIPYYQIGSDSYNELENKSTYPSKKNILKAIEDLAIISHDNSINIIYYSGHSTVNGSWVLASTSGSSFNAENEVNENQILSVEEIYNQFENIKGKKVLIVDSCYSGNFYKEDSYSVEEENFTIAQAYQKFISSEKNEDDIYILCASHADTQSYEPIYYLNERVHGYFTKALLEGLGWCDGEKGVLTFDRIENVIDDEDGIQGILSEGVPPAAVNGILSIDSLLSYIKKNQEIPLSSEGYISSYQYPQVSSGRFDLVLFIY